MFLIKLLFSNGEDPLEVTEISSLRHVSEPFVIYVEREADFSQPVNISIRELPKEILLEMDGIEGKSDVFYTKQEITVSHITGPKTFEVLLNVHTDFTTDGEGSVPIYKHSFTVYP